MKTLLLMSLLAAAPKGVGKLEIPKIETQKLDLNMPALPKGDGMASTAADKGPELKTAPGSVTAPSHGASSAKVEKATHARDFALTLDGRRPKSALDGFKIDKVPSHIEPFKTCLRFSSSDGNPAAVIVKLVSPGGEELLASRGDVVFGKTNQIDFVIDWEGFEARQEGNYRVTVSVDGAPGGDFPIPVALKAAK